jgi:hypothetical protein
MAFNERELIEIIEKQLDLIIFLIVPKKKSVHLVLTTNINNSKFIIMSLSIASNQTTLGTVALLDSVTQQPVTATFTNIAASSDDDAAFTTSLDASNNVVITGVAEGTGNLTVSATASYTDSNGNPQTADLSVVISVTITAVVTADAVELTVNFAPPTQQALTASLKKK